MSNLQQIMWTPVPNGIAGSGNSAQLRVSVYVAPRLYADAPTTLASFPDFLHWASLVSAMSFTADFTYSNSTPSVLAAKDQASPAPDNDLWSALFSSTIPVNPYAFTDHSTKFMQSYPVRNVENTIKGSYGRFLTATPNGAPMGMVAPAPSGIQQLLNPYDLAFYHYGWNARVGGRDQRPPVGALDFPEEAYDLLAKEIIYDPYTQNIDGAVANVVTPSALDSSLTFMPDHIELRNRFFQHRLFFRRGAPNLTTPRPSQTEPDFHEAMAAMAAYPQLMRKLGIVVDLLVPLTGLGLPQNDPTLTMRVSPSWTSSSSVAGPHITPLTYCTLTASDFFASSRGTIYVTPPPAEVEAGMVNMTGVGDYGLSQIDIDGAAAKLVHYANTAGNVMFRGTADSPSTIPLPALRSGGIQVVRHGHASFVMDRLKRNAGNNPARGASDQFPVYAEDLLRGYRVDIFDVAANKWLTLMARDGTYSFPAATKSTNKHFTLSDEGYTSHSVTQDNTNPHSDNYAHEKLIRWNGWSLAAPRPGNVTDDEGNVKTVHDSPSQHFNMQVSFEVTPGSMPKLRFGRQYRVRLRAVDLAGNSPLVTSSDDTHALPNPHAAAPDNTPLTYRRFEPVPSPTVVPHDAFSRPDDSPPFEDPGEAVDRLVIRSDTGAVSPTFMADYIKRLDQVYHYPGFTVISQRHIAPPRTTAEIAERLGMFDTGPGGTMDPASYLKLTSHDGSFGTDKTLGILGAYPVDQLTLPYLPDPLARGVSFVGLPGSTAKSPAAGIPGVDKFTFSGSWPDMKPFRIQVIGLKSTDAQKPPSFDATKNILSVYLKQADVFDVQLSSFFNAGDLNLLGMWQWAQDYLKATGGSAPAQMAAAAVAGLLYWLTPSHTITFVHAVQRPLVQPKFATLSALKYTIGQTYAVLANFGPRGPGGKLTYPPVPVDGKSTSRLDLQASWTEPIDDGVDPSGFHRVSGRAIPIGIQIAPTDAGVPFDLASNRRHHFPDTKYRRVTYTMIATSRFAKYFPFKDDEIASGKTPVTVSSPPVTVDVANSAPPDAPKILYVIPAFKWDPDVKSGGKTTSARHGGVVRVYMDRPWFSSGDGELLGVVTQWRAGQAGALKDTVLSAMSKPFQQAPVPPKDYVDPPLQPFVTLWGRDTVWRSAAMTYAPTYKSFPLANPAAGGRTDTKQSLLEYGQLSVAISSHAVKFDTSRQLWYSDIQMTFGDSYYPFVRLALVRYQPNSIAGAFVSRVVMADYVQLAPDRVATVTTNINSHDKRQVGVTVVGIGPIVPSNHHIKNQFTVSVETQQAGIAGDMAWVPVPNSVYDMNATPVSGSTTQYSWATTITLPHPVGSQPYRLVFKEYEPSYTWDPTNDIQPIRRIVYADTVDL